MLEAVTYRYRGHSVADAGLSYRTSEEIAERKARDPIERFNARLIESGVSPDELEGAEERARAAVARAVELAEVDSEPPLSELAAGMPAQGSDEQFARTRAGSPFGERELVFDGGLGR